jgi:glutamate racemase
VAAATADVQCKISTNLVGVAQAVQAATDQVYIGMHATQLATYKNHLQDEIRAAGPDLP